MEKHHMHVTYMKLNLGKKEHKLRSSKSTGEQKKMRRTSRTLYVLSGKNRGATGKKKEPLKAMLPLLWVLITQQKVGKHGLNGKKIH